MSYIWTAFIFVFIDNVALSSLFGLERGREDEGRGAVETLVICILCMACGLAACGLDRLLSLINARLAAIPAAACLSFLACQGLAAAASRIRPGMAPRIRASMIRIESSGIVYAISFIPAQAGLDTVGALTSSLAATAGYVSATWLLRLINQRSGLEDIPRPFAGTPIFLINAGLLALAFSAFERLFAMGPRP
jgi:electron transport complex protein RnfA